MEAFFFQRGKELCLHLSIFILFPELLVKAKQMFTLLAQRWRTANVAFTKCNMKAFIMWWGQNESHFVYELATGSSIKLNIIVSLPSQYSSTFPILYKLSVDRISSGQRDSWPCWFQEPTQQFCMDNRVGSDLEMSSVPQVIWGIGGGFTISCLTFKSAQYLAFLSFSLSFFFPSSFFLHMTHSTYQFPLVQIYLSPIWKVSKFFV